MKFYSIPSSLTRSSGSRMLAVRSVTLMLLTAVSARYAQAEDAGVMPLAKKENLPRTVVIAKTVPRQWLQWPISGTVVDSKGQPLPGVSVKVKGTTTGAVTDANGNFQVDVANENVTLVFSFLGYEGKEVAVGRERTFHVQLNELSTSLGEVTIVGYGTQKKTSLTSAVAEVKGTELARSPVPNITNSLAGRVPGIVARPNGGVPGQDNANIYVRGISTTGNNNALVVVDGIIRNNVSQIDPNTIESVSILKDAAAVAPYGLGGANGVILITTKHGKTGTPTITLNSYYGFQMPTVQPKMLNAVDYMTLKNEANLNSGANPNDPPEFSQDLINNYGNLNAVNPDLYPNSNAQRDLVSLNQPQQNYNLQVSGGSEKVKYYAGFNFFRQQGIYDPLYYNRYNYNVMLDINATSSTKLTLSLNNAVEKNQTSPNPVAISYIPTRAIYFSNGLPGASGDASPGGLLESGSYNRIFRTQALNSLAVDQQLPFVKGLSVKGVFSYDPSTAENKGWNRPTYYYLYNNSSSPARFDRVLNGDGQTTLSQDYSKTHNFTYQGYINYHNVFDNDHEVTGLLVAEARRSNFNTFSASRRGYNVDLDELNSGSSDKLNFNNGGTSSKASQVGYVYRVNYGYKGRYLLEATGRYDGHYYFAPGKRWAFFPAFSAGWRMSEEKFIKDHWDWVDNLKLRGSWGKSGNLAGQPFQYLTAYSLYGNAYAFGASGLVQGSYIPLEANTALTWEKSNKSDVGLDAAFWKNKLTVQTDFFYEKRTGMLLPPAITVPVEYGLDLAEQNAGEMSNRGFELVVGTNQRFKDDLTFSVSGNFTYAKNKLIQVFETDATRNNPNRSRTGRPLGTPFGYQALGLFTTGDDKNGDGVINAADGYPIQQFGTLHPGDVKYADLNGDGKIDANDETAVGYPLYPQMTYGLTLASTWKGFDVSLFFQGAAQASLNIQGYQTVPFRLNNTNTSYEYFNNRWTPQNQDAKYPRAYSSKNTNNTTNPVNGDGFGNFSSSLWMANTGFLRLKTAVIGYTLPSKLMERVKIKSLRVYATAQNLFTWSALDFMDPETGYSQREEAYPVMKTIIFGVNVNF